jgi:hypothetical protein
MHLGAGSSQCLTSLLTADPETIKLLLWLQESLGEEVLRMSNDEIVSRTRLLDNEIKV